MKLSKAQDKLMNRAKENIDFARTHTVIDWAARENGHGTEEALSRTIECYIRCGFTREQAVEMVNEKDTKYAERYGQYYEDAKNGIVLIRCNGRTLHKLAELGLIEIVYDSSNSGFGIDTVKILNY